MSYFDVISRRASETTTKAVKKARDFAEKEKLRSMISDEEGKINSTYNQLGKMYVSVHRDDCEEIFNDMINAIDGSEKKIVEYQKQIQEVDGVRRCEKCGAEVPNDALFCDSCGARMNNAHTTNYIDKIKCEHCGALVNRGMKFCTACGSPINNTIAPNPEISSDTPVTNKAETEAGKTKRCPECGTEMAADMEFCTECGTKI